jgi:hypothetical protein
MQGAVQVGYAGLLVRVVGVVSDPPTAHFNTTNWAPPTPAVPLPGLRKPVLVDKFTPV